jgi:hypothetical protein
MHATAVLAGTYAPNHKRTEPWRFHLLGPEAVQRVCRLNADLVAQKKGAEAGEKKLKRWLAMPGWLGVFCHLPVFCHVLPHRLHVDCHHFKLPDAAEPERSVDVRASRNATMPCQVIVRVTKRNVTTENLPVATQVLEDGAAASFEVCWRQHRMFFLARACLCTHAPPVHSKCSLMMPAHRFAHGRVLAPEPRVCARVSARDTEQLHLRPVRNDHPHAYLRPQHSALAQS